MKTLEFEGGVYVAKYDTKTLQVVEAYDWNGNEAPDWVWEAAEDEIGA